MAKPPKKFSSIMPDLTQPFERSRARMEIMNYILSFCITSDWDGAIEYGRMTPGIHGFVPADRATRPVRVGDLVILRAAPVSKFIIGWLVEIENTESGFDERYCVESLEDGTQCWWSNVGLSYFPRKDLQEKWRWTDKQYEFSARWSKTAHPLISGRVNQSKFHHDGSVTVSIRPYWSGDNDPRPSHTFPDWRKVTVGEMKRVAEVLDTELKKSLAKPEDLS